MNETRWLHCIPLLAACFVIPPTLAAQESEPLTLQQTVDLALRQSSARILNFTRQRINEGVELPIEGTRAELVEARLEQRIVQLESRERVLQHEFAALLGMPADRRIEVESEALSLDEPQRESDLIERALRTNLELRQANYERRARERRLAGEIGTKWPTVDLFGQYGLFARFNNFDDYFRRFQRNNFNVGLQI